MDTGSKISLIKETIVVNHTEIFDNEDPNPYFGINSSELKILGMVRLNVNIKSNININLNFRVVPDHAMRHDCLIGRDVLFRKDIKMEIIGGPGESNSQKSNYHKRLTITITISYDSVVKQLMLIEYDSSELELDIGSRKNKNFQEREIKSVLDKYYCINKSQTVNSSPMTINLNNETPFNFSPKRLSLAEKRITDELVEELLRDGVIRRSNSPFASRLVLLKKKR